MKKMIMLLLICISASVCFAQKKPTTSPPSSKCKYPKEELRGKTQKEQSAILRPYYECKKLETESRKLNKNGDIEKYRRERERQQAEREKQQKEREQNSNNNRQNK